MDKYIENIGCPKCGSSDALGVYERENGEHYGHCFSCESYVPNPYNKSDEEIEEDKEDFGKVSQYDLSEASINPLITRGISKEVCQKYGVKSILNDNFVDVVHLYPYTLLDGSKATCQRVVEGKKFTWLSKPVKPLLFGQEICGEGGKMIMITEGVCDCLAAVEMLNKCDKQYRVVSIPNGASASVKDIQNNYEWLSTFENIFLAFDQDKPGQDAAVKVSNLFPPNVVKNMRFSEKDPNAMLLANKHKEFLQSVFSAKESRPTGIVSVDDIFEEAIKPPKIGKSFPWKTLTDVTYGYRTGELWGIGAGCIDVLTEYLSPTGWKRISEYNGGLVSQVDDNDTLSFVEPLNYIKEPCEFMYPITARRGLDMMLSSEHRIVAEDLKGNRTVIIAEDFVNKQNNTIRGCRLAIPTVFNINLEGINYSDDYIRLKVAIFADGSFHHKSKLPRCCIRVKKVRKIERLKNLLEQLNIEYKLSIHKGNYHSFYFYVDNTDKTFSNTSLNWYKCSTHQLGIICDESRYWDGSEDRWSYYTSIKEDADFIQYAHSAIGYRASIQVQDNRGKLIKGKWETKCIKYTVRRCGNSLIEPSYTIPIIKTPTLDGFKYCFTVPTGKLLCRRNGNIFITGNSGSGKTEFFKEMINNTIYAHGEVAGVIFLEEEAAKTLKVLAGKRVNKRFHIPQDRGGDWTVEELVDGINDLRDKVYLFSHMGSKNWEEIKEKIRYMVVVLGIKDIYLDHLTALVAQEDNEYKALNKLMEEMSSLTHELDCTIFYISHLRKASGTPHEEGGRVAADQFKGSGAIVFWSNFLIGLERNQQADDEEERNTTTLRVLKDRNTGLATGTTFKLKYDHETGRWNELDMDDLNEDWE